MSAAGGAWRTLQAVQCPGGAGSRCELGEAVWRYAVSKYARVGCLVVRWGGCLVIRCLVVRCVSCCLALLWSPPLTHAHACARAHRGGWYRRWRNCCRFPAPASHCAPSRFDLHCCRFPAPASRCAPSRSALGFRVMAALLSVPYCTMSRLISLNVCYPQL